MGEHTRKESGLVFELILYDSCFLNNDVYLHVHSYRICVQGVLDAAKSKNLTKVNFLARKQMLEDGTPIDFANTSTIPDTYGFRSTCGQKACGSTCTDCAVKTACKAYAKACARKPGTCATRSVCRVEGQVPCLSYAQIIDPRGCEAAAQSFCQSRCEKEDKISQLYSTISFSGGGSGLTYTMNDAVDVSSSSSSSSSFDIGFGINFGLHIVLATPSFDIGLSNENHFVESSETSTGTSESKSVSRSFTLSDPDVEDEFDVEVRTGCIYLVFVRACICSIARLM
jgi:hypothetical protein